jgi:hypothetical protein
MTTHLTSSGQIRYVYHIIVLLTGCFCTGPGIDSMSAVFAQAKARRAAGQYSWSRIYTGPIQKQPVNNTFIK